MPRYCPVCGKPDSEKNFQGELCFECACGMEEPLPKVKVAVCELCGCVVDKARKRKPLSLNDEITRQLRLKGAMPQYDESFCFVEYASGHGKVRKQISVCIFKAQCAECARSKSQYFEAIIQIRGAEKEKVEKVASRLASRMRLRSFVSKIERLKEGIDIYCGSRSEAIATLNAFGFGFKRTEKLAGQRDGRRLYRTTLLVRIGEAEGKGD